MGFVGKGGAEIAGPENDGPNLKGWKMQDLENDVPGHMKCC